MDVTMSLSITRALVHSGIQINVEAFFRSLVSGLVMSANPRIKGCWNPRMPSVLLTSLTDLSIIGLSLIPVILLVDADFTVF